MPILLVILPPLIVQIGEGIREHYKRKMHREDADRLTALEQRVTELEKGKESK